MNKEKLKHLPINFLVSLPIFGLTILVTTTWLDINFWVGIGISFYVYLADVINSSQKDYLEEKIKSLEIEFKKYVAEESRKN